MSAQMSASNIQELVDILEKRYPDSAFALHMQENGDNYMGKLEVIKEIKKLGGLVDDKRDATK